MRRRVIVRVNCACLARRALRTVQESSWSQQALTSQAIEGETYRVKRFSHWWRAVVFLTQASKFNIEPNGENFDISPRRRPRVTNV